MSSPFDNGERQSRQQSRAQARESAKLRQKFQLIALHGQRDRRANALEAARDRDILIRHIQQALRTRSYNLYGVLQALQGIIADLIANAANGDPTRLGEGLALSSEATAAKALEIFEQNRELSE